MGDGLFVNRAEDVDWRVSVGSRLKVSHEVFALVTTLQTADAIVNLFRDGLARQPATGTERTVVAECAPTNRDRPIDVGASESGIDADTLNPVPVQLFQVVAVHKIAMTVGSPIHFGAVMRLIFS